MTDETAFVRDTEAEPNMRTPLEATDFIADAITEAFGERRPDYAEGCAARDAWKQYDDLRALTGEVAPVAVGMVHRIEHDGFEGTAQGSYITREGKRGVVLQQVGTKVVHVYGEKWLSPDALAVPAPPVEGLVEALKFARDILERAEEELRMIRMKDSAALYDVGLRGLGFGLAYQKIDAAISAPQGGVPEGWKPTHVHVKRGSRYRITGHARLQTERPLEDNRDVIVYEGEDGAVWVRPYHEFYDGRFEEIAASKGGPA